MRRGSPSRSAAGRTRVEKDAIMELDAATVGVVVALRSARFFLLARWRLILEGGAETWPCRRYQQSGRQ
jgi:hypothetical protein